MLWCPDLEFLLLNHSEGERIGKDEGTEKVPETGFLTFLSGEIWWTELGLILCLALIMCWGSLGYLAQVVSSVGRVWNQNWPLKGQSVLKKKFIRKDECGTYLSVGQTSKGMSFSWHLPDKVSHLKTWTKQWCHSKGCFPCSKGDHSKKITERVFQKLAAYGNPRLIILNKCSEMKPTIIFSGY